MAICAGCGCIKPVIPRGYRRASMYCSPACVRRSQNERYLLKAYGEDYVRDHIESEIRRARHERLRKQRNKSKKVFVPSVELADLKDTPLHVLPFQKRWGR